MVRLKTRYILFEILYPPTTVSLTGPSPEYLLSLHQSSPQAINAKLLFKLLRSSIEEYFGAYGAGTTGSNLVLKYFSNQTSTGIMRCAREYYRLVCAALSLITVVEGKRVVLRVVNVSGTINKCESFAMKRNHALMLKLQKRTDGTTGLEDLVAVTDDEDDNDI